MEQSEASAPARRKRWPLIVAVSLLALFLAGVGVYVSGLWVWLVPSRSLSQARVPADIVRTKLLVSAYTVDGEPWAGVSHLAFAKAEPWSTKPECRAVAVGGDRVRTSVPVEVNAEPGADCPRWMVWNLMRHPVALTLGITEGKALGRWVDDNPDVEALRRSELFRGLFSEALEVARIQGRDLLLADFAGEFAWPFLKDALAADASLAHDVVHGQGGWVLSFDGRRARLARFGLVSLVEALATEGYEVRGLGSAVWGFQLGPKKLFTAELDHRIFVATSVSGLLNVMDAGAQKASFQTGGNVRALVRLEAWLGPRILETLTGKSEWSVEAGLALDESKGRPTEFVVESFPAAASLAPKIFSGVLASVPADVLAVAALSAPITSEFGPAYLARFSKESGKIFTFPKAGEGGVAVVWRLRGEPGEGGISETGLVVADPKNELQERIRGFFRDESLARYCPRQHTWLMASTEALLKEMLATCQGARVALAAFVPTEKEVLLAFNSIHLVRETYRAGGGDPRLAPTPLETPANGAASETLDARRKALTELTDRVERESLAWPLFGYSGGRKGDDALRLEGFVTSSVKGLYGETKP